MNYAKLHFFMAMKMSAAEIVRAFITMPITDSRTYSTSLYRIVVIIAISSGTRFMRIP
jgi:hypothetical protein